MLPPNLQLRPATNADCATVAELIVKILNEYGLAPDHATTDLDLTDLEGFYQKQGGSFDVLVDLPKGQIVGTVGWHPIDATCVELRKMYVDPAFRGRGLGRMLLDRALAEIRKRNYQRVVLETATVLKEALRLYQSTGFQPCAMMCPSARRCDVTMELLLG